MGSSSKRRQTMAKMTRERALQERRELKQQRKDEKKQKAAEEAREQVTVLPEEPQDEGESEDGSPDDE